MSEDKAKAGLTKDPRLVALNRLATIDLMPSGQLTEFQDRMAGLRSCYQLTEGELANSPVCPHCQFRPVNETLGFASAANQLTTLDTKLDELLAGWTQTLLDNLDDPIIQGNLELLKSGDRKQIEVFIASKALPEPLTAEFIAAVRDALSGLTKEVVKVADEAGKIAPKSPYTPRVRYEGAVARCKLKQYDDAAAVLVLVSDRDLPRRRVGVAGVAGGGAAARDE